MLWPCRACWVLEWSGTPSYVEVSSGLERLVVFRRDGVRFVPLRLGKVDWSKQGLGVFRFGVVRFGVARRVVMRCALLRQGFFF